MKEKLVRGAIGVIVLVGLAAVGAANYTTPEQDQMYEAQRVAREQAIAACEAKHWIWSSEDCKKPCDYECVQNLKFQRKMYDAIRKANDPWSD